MLVAQSLMNESFGVIWTSVIKRDDSSGEGKVAVKCVSTIFDQLISSPILNINYIGSR